jgi:2-keto-4-pentenoate hydratase/2-oxohepta-3-ene-1,7-dioic acid hydratase in catechol pathway
VTTVDEVPSGDDLRLQTWVNGELRQDSRTSDLIFGCQELVDFISQTNTLAPGDLILTGTPNGVGMAFKPPKFLVSGDRVRIAIEGLGEIDHAVE